MFYSYNGLKIYYETIGIGDPVVFLHGWGCSLDVFKVVAKEISKKYCVYLIDFPGFGKSVEPDFLIDIKGMAKLINSFIVIFFTTTKKDNKVLEWQKAAIADGFKISELDYKLRGSGDFMGDRQSGKFMNDLGALNYGTDSIFLAKKISDDITKSDLATKLIEAGGYKKDNEYKSSRQVICDLVDIVSKNGNLLINIGPKPDGTFTDEETKVLFDMGEWLFVNGEGIYGTTFWKTFGEGEVNVDGGYFTDGNEKAYTDKDFRFTYKNGFLYVFQMRPSNSVEIKTLRLHDTRDFFIENVELLGSNEKIDYTRDKEALKINLKGEFENDLPICFKIEIG